jgi:hypothetical protein
VRRNHLALQLAYQIVVVARELGEAQELVAPEILEIDLLWLHGFSLHGTGLFWCLLNYLYEV